MKNHPVSAAGFKFIFLNFYYDEQYQEPSLSFLM